MWSTKQRIERKVEALTRVERRRFHVPEKAKVGVNVVGDELSVECCGICGRSLKTARHRTTDENVT